MRQLCGCCGEDEVIAWRDGETALCPACCAKANHPDGEDGHGYDYERSERGYFCRYCGEEAPPQWYDDLAAHMDELEAGSGRSAGATQ